jgi:hypothetical protein
MAFTAILCFRWLASGLRADELGRALSGFLESRDRLEAVMESAQWDREIH